MIKRILVALDPGTDSLVGTQFAIHIARATGARITGLAVVDTEHIESSSRGGGIGSMYYAEKLRENLTQETREHARKLINDFEMNVEGSGVDHIEMMEEGVPFQRIVEDMKYHDLLVMGSDPHFFYSHPKQRTNTLAGVFHNTIGPSLIVPAQYREEKRFSMPQMEKILHRGPFVASFRWHRLAPILKSRYYMYTRKMTSTPSYTWN